MEPKVLVLEDDKVFRQKILVPQLEQRGYRVVEATRIRQAEQLLATEQPDLLVVDGLLPDGNGIDFIKRLREVGEQVPVLFLSAFFKDLGTFEQLRRLGRVEVLRKPINADLLARLCANLLAGRSTAEQ